MTQPTIQKLEEPFAGSRLMDALRHPDPVRVHGAWIYLFASVGAGALVGADHGVERPMLAGTGFVGAFLVTAALLTGVRRKGRQILVGLLLAVLAPLAAVGVGAGREFLPIAALAAVPALTATWLGKSWGFLSRTTMVMGIAALAMAAPAAAVAGGASLPRSAVLFGLLWVFFCWRTLRLATALESEHTWDRRQLRARGLREAGIAAVWMLTVAVSLRIL